MKKLLTAVTAVAMLGLTPAAFAQGGSSAGGSSGSSSQQGSDIGGSGSSSQQGSDVGGSGSTQHGGSGSMGGSTGSTGSTGSMGQAAGAQELEGRVLKASKDQVTIEYQGAAIPFQVKRDTSFQGVKSARELKEGQQVRANFELSKSNRNELKSIEVVPSGGSTGGTGTEQPSGSDQGGSGSDFGGSGSDTNQQQKDQNKDLGNSPY